jgi:hypothetical protein
MLFLYENLGLFLVVSASIVEVETCFDVEELLCVSRVAAGGSAPTET